MTIRGFRIEMDEAAEWYYVVGTSLLVADAVEMKMSGESADRIADRFGVPRDAVLAALEFAERLEE